MARNARKLAARTSLTTNPNNNKTGTHQVVGTGDIHVVKFTGLNSGDSLTDIGINIFTADGNVRVKVYDDVAGEPTNLLGESNSTVTSGTGIQNIPLITPAIVPANGIVWAGFETDSILLDLYFTLGASGVEKTVTHTYGTGVDPFGTATNGTDEYNITLSLIGSGILVNRTGKIRHIYVAKAGTGASKLGLNAGSVSSSILYEVDGFSVIIPHINIDTNFSGALYAEVTGDAEFNVVYE